MLNESDYQLLPEDYSNYDLNFKIIIVGDPGVGKSCITMKAVKKIFEDYYSPTIGFEFYTFKVRIKETDIRLQIWDTCGQENYRSLIQGFYRNSSLAILVYAIDNAKSFENLELWLNDIKMNSNPNIRIFLIGNKKDLEENREVHTDDAETFSHEHNLNLFLESSAKSGFNTEKMFVEAAHILFEDSQKLKMDIDRDSNLGQNQIITEDNTDEPKKRKKCC